MSINVLVSPVNTDVHIKKVNTSVQVNLTSMKKVMLYYDVVSHGVTNSRGGIEFNADN